jgi:hypothetical protein
MSTKNYKPLFVKSESHKKFKELAFKKNINMSDLFDQFIDAPPCKTKSHLINFDVSIFNMKPKKRRFK